MMLFINISHSLLYRPPGSSTSSAVSVTPSASVTPATSVAPAASPIQQGPVWKGFLGMGDMTKFFCVAFTVSGNTNRINLVSYCEGRGVL